MKRVILKPLSSKSKTQPSSRTGTPTRSSRLIRPLARPTANLEKAAQTEQCLSAIFESLKTFQNLSKCLADYSALADFKPDFINLFKDEKARKEIALSAVLEFVAVSMLAGTASNAGHLGGVQGQMRNLIFYVHQNYLHFAEFLLSRVTIDISQSIWAYMLKTAIQHKKVKRQARGDLVLWIHEHCEIISNLIRQLATSRSSLPPNLQNTAIRVLASVHTISYQKCREMMEKVVSETRFLPPVASLEQIYTLVLDLDETLVHYVEVPEGESRVLVRPGCETFLRNMSQYYEVVIFTAAMQDYADWVINQLDQGKWVSARLYRQHTVPSGNFFLKDLSKLGRDLARVIIVDNIAENFALQPENGIVIRSWIDDEGDEALSQLEPLLAEMPKRKVPDVRIALRQFREQMLQRIAQGDPTPHLNLHILD